MTRLVCSNDIINPGAVRYPPYARHLTGAELWRLLTRNDRRIARAVAEIWEQEAEDADWYAEHYGELLAEGRSAQRRYTRIERYLKANPLHTCAPKPEGWDMWPMDDNDIPF